MFLLPVAQDIVVGLIPQVTWIRVCNVVWKREESKMLSIMRQNGGKTQIALLEEQVKVKIQV